MDASSGGILVAVAGALWVVYLLPTWLRRRQYLATERNAVRLQQTLRILAETAETPEEVRAEATAREVASKQRILREREQSARAEASAAERLAQAERRAAELAARATERRARELESEAARVATASSPRRRRQQRALCALALLTGLLIVLTGLVVMALGGTPLVAFSGLLLGGGAFGALVRLAPKRASVPEAAVSPSAVPVTAEFEPVDIDEPVPESRPGWTPQPLPRPLHLSRGTIAAAAMASIDAAEELRRAAVSEELERRVAAQAPAVPKLPQRPAAPAAETPALQAPTSAAANPYARMGVVEEPSGTFNDLDAVLRRRRAV